MSTRAKPNPEPLKIACPTCGKKFVPVMASNCMPFCSDRCKLIDLGRWMNEEIGLPHVPSEDDEEEIEPPPQVREWRFE